MDKQEIIDLIKKTLNEETSSKQFTVAQTSLHRHNGTDSQRIQGKDIINNTSSLIFWQSIASETFQITNLYNPKQMQFYGYAADNAAGPATHRALVTGSAYFGDCLTYVGLGFGTSVSSITGSGATQSNIIQCCSSMFVDASTVGNTKVGASAVNFVYVVDNTATVVATATVIANDTGSISIQTVLSSGWAITGGVVIT